MTRSVATALNVVGVITFIALGACVLAWLALQRGYWLARRQVVEWKTRYAREQMRRVDRETFAKIQRASRPQQELRP